MIMQKSELTRDMAGRAGGTRATASSSAILTLNAGSSSLKFALFAAADTGLDVCASGQIEGLGVAPHLVVSASDGTVLEDARLGGDKASDHQHAIEHILAFLKSHFPAAEISAVGHRVVHGGPRHSAPVVLTDSIIDELSTFIQLAPLHQPYNLAGVIAARSAFPDAVQVGCFDTAFHRLHPWVNDTFALPRRYYEKGVRRYGFHGLSYEYVSKRLGEIAPMHAAGRVVVAHLGSGASMCAMRGGSSVGSTMGFSALEGLPMGTRCGEIDPGVVLYLRDEEKLSSKEIIDLLYKQSGLKGLSGISGDMRQLEAAGTLEAQQAIEYFVNHVQRELGGMAALLQGIDALVFCGGIGENSHFVREKVCSGLEWLGIEIDTARNRAHETIVSSEQSRVKIFKVKTNEEAMIAEHTAELLRSAQSGPAADCGYSPRTRRRA
jgi:acetate kinase